MIDITVRTVYEFVAGTAIFWSGWSIRRWLYAEYLPPYPQLAAAQTISVLEDYRRDMDKLMQSHAAVGPEVKTAITDCMRHFDEAFKRAVGQC